MKTITSATDVETTNVIGQIFSKTFLNDMINNENVKPKGRKCHDDVKKFATTLYFYSPKAILGNYRNGFAPIYSA